MTKYMKELGIDKLEVFLPNKKKWTFSLYSATPIEGTW